MAVTSERSAPSSLHHARSAPLRSAPLRSTPRSVISSKSALFNIAPAKKRSPAA